jgi:hypothetical protein
MSLTEDERRYLDEKFKSLHKRLDEFAGLIPRVNHLEIEVSKRPTTIQVIAACGFFLSLGIIIGSLAL